MQNLYLGWWITMVLMPIFCPVDVNDIYLGNLELICNDDTKEQKYSLIDTSLKEESFKPMYKGPQARNAEEHRKLFKMANKSVDINSLSFDCKVCQHVCHIDISEMVCLVRPVIVPEK